MIKIRKALPLIILLSLLSLLYFSYRSQEIKAKDWKRLNDKIDYEIFSFRGESGIAIKDLARNWNIQHNPDKLFPAASLIKVPIMASCLLAAEEGRIDLKDKIRLKEKHKAGGSGRLKNMKAGEEFTIEELIGMMITLSDNTAANILIELLGFDYINDCFKKMGLKNTNLSCKIMDFGSRRAGIENYTSASDMSCLLDKIYHKRLLNYRISKRCLELLKDQKINDRIPAKLPKEILVAHKTGLLKGICHDMGIVFTNRGNFIICVLTKHKNKTAQPAKNLIAKIALLAYNYYNDEDK